MVPPYSVWISRVRTYSGFRSLRSRFDYRAFTFFGWASHPILLRLLLLFPVRTPGVLLPPVWPLSLSLATTHEISVDVFSCPYLDVSVQTVPLVHLFDSMHDACERNVLESSTIDGDSPVLEAS